MSKDSKKDDGSSSSGEHRQQSLAQPHESASSISSPLVDIYSASNCRVSTWLWSASAICVASLAYLLVTRVVFPLVAEHHQSHSANNVNVPWKLVVFIGLSCAVSTAVPGLFTISCVASGFALGSGLGAVVAVTGTLTGLSLSFEAGRTVFRERASAIVAQRWPSAQALLQLHPTKAVWISWFFPMPLAIKIFFWAACSNVSLWRFILSVVVVALPHISTLAFVGDQVSSLGEGKSGTHERIFFVLGLVSVAVATVALSRWARSAVAAVAVVENPA